MAALPSYVTYFFIKKTKKITDWLKMRLTPPTTLPFFGELPPTTLPELGHRRDGGGVPAGGIGSPRPLPAGGDFGKGAIDLGGLEVYEALYLKKIWDTHSGGPKGLGASFYEPTSIPSGFNLIGHYCKPNSIAMFATVLTAKDTTGDPSQGALKSPIDYTLIWTSKGLNVSQREDGYIWLPIPPNGYKAIGHIVTTSPVKPSLDKVRCVRSDFTDLTKVDKWIWGHKMLTSTSIVNLHTIKQC
ncbi:putative vacuolar protein sorting-associated protein [Helianthus annuus]|nr:putative vacuolar protein sorting-associated protein [Helianthus annuus]